MPLTPNNREEHWLQGMVDGQTTLEPNKRREYWYKEIVDAIGSGGGGGTGGGVLVVTLDFDTLTLDKTWNEIASSSLAVLKVNADNATHFSTLYMTNILGENEFAVYFFRIEGGSRIESETFKASSADGYPVAEE